MAEGGGLLNRYRVKSSIGGSNPPLSASHFPSALNLLDISRVLRAVPWMDAGARFHCCPQSTARRPSGAEKEREMRHLSIGS